MQINLTWEFTAMLLVVAYSFFATLTTPMTFFAIMVLWAATLSVADKLSEMLLWNAIDTVLERLK